MDTMETVDLISPTECKLWTPWNSLERVDSPPIDSLSAAQRIELVTLIEGIITHRGEYPQKLVFLGNR